MPLTLPVTPEMYSDIKTLSTKQSFLMTHADVRRGSLFGNKILVDTDDSYAKIQGVKGEKKDITEKQLDDVTVIPYPIYDILKFPEADYDDKRDVYNQIVTNMANKISRTVDALGFGKTGVASDLYDNLTESDTIQLETADDIVGAVTDLEDNGYDASAWVFTPTGKREIYGIKDSLEKPIFGDYLSNGLRSIMGLPADSSRHIDVSGAAGTVRGYMGDFSKMVISIAKDMTLKETREGEAFLNNEVWVRAEMFVGIRIAMPDAFRKIIPVT